MKIDINKFNEYTQQGWLRCQNHPRLDLLIWNYTQQTQFDQKWDDVTLICRGLVTLSDGTVIAKPFPKFFNLEENQHKPTKEFEVYDKVDGSLGIVFNYQNEIICATRGSFTSDQAIKGFEILQKQEPKLVVPKGYTLLFEIIYPENRIVIDYGQEMMVLLGIYDHNFKELPYHFLSNFSSNVVKRYDGIDDYEKLKELNIQNQEGYVVRFSNGDRCKIKFEEYVRLHRILTNTSTVSIWESLRLGKGLDLENIPDEIFTKIKEYENNLKNQYKSIEQEAILMYNTISHIKNRKKFALRVLEIKNKLLEIIIFCLRDGKNYSDFIWQNIRPEYRIL